jgi:hypothetical protein
VQSIVFRRAANLREHAYALVPGSLTLGRAPHAALDLDAPGVAPLHARLSFDGRGFTIEAIGGPAAAVTVDGLRAPAETPLPLSPGVRISVGGAAFTVHETTDAEFTAGA